MKWLVVGAALLQAAAPGVRVLERGSQSYIEAPQQVVARSQAEFDRFWKTHAANRLAPSVDFAREMVVGLFVGTRNTAGYSVEMAGVDQDANVLIVHYRESEPPKGAVAAQVITSPYFLAAVPAFNGQVRFEKVQ